MAYALLFFTADRNSAHSREFRSNAKKKKIVAPSEVYSVIILQFIILGFVAN
jgi:hypothetical protein